MPKIEVIKDDLRHLLKQDLNDEQLETILESAKAEMDEIREDSYKIELNDTNRPDLWSCAGLARQINMYSNGCSYSYDFFSKESPKKIIVDPNLEKIRPFIVGFAVKNIPITEPLLLELIQNQEKFSQNFGSKRHDIAIGIYKLANIEFPVSYRAVKPEEIRFTPLGGEKDLNLREILEVHPKGIEFGHIVKNYNKYPIILDKQNNVLSFPPVINSRYIGEVEVGDTDIFIELTGFTLANMLLVANIFACDLADRGGEVVPVEIQYSFDTPFGKSFVVPHDFKNRISINKDELKRMIGHEPSGDEISANLAKMGYYNISKEKNLISVEVPPYRNDIMHPVDIIEDYIIGKGLNNFPVEMPSDFTVGALTPIERYSDRIRNIAVGMGFQEVISNVLTSREKMVDRMNLSSTDLAEISNPMTESYNVLQNSLIPSLLEIEAFSAKADYPHRIFEAGEVILRDNDSNYGFETCLNLGLLNAHPKTNFSEMRSYVDNILYYAGIDQFDLKPFEISFLLPGRSAQIFYKNQSIGYFGEIHPDVLENWDINMPCTILELSASTLFSIIQKPQ